MDILQLKYFKVLADTQNMTRAANELHIAQPALSRTLRNLEQELGMLLFDRVGKYIYLNENGEILLKHANIMLREFANAETELREKRGSLDQSVSLSVHAGSKFLPSLIRGFKERYPNITLNIMQQSKSDHTHEKSDISIYSSINPASGENSLTLMEEEICLAMPADHAFSNLECIHLEDIADEPFISLYKGLGLRTVLDEYCNMAGFEPTIILESDSPSTVYDLISLGVGLSFIPMISWQGIDESKAVKLVKIKNPRCMRYINMSWNSDRYRSRASVQMRKYLVEFYRETGRKYTENGK